MNYEEMVKEAYEEIVGFDKEASTEKKVYFPIRFDGKLNPGQTMGDIIGHQQNLKKALIAAGAVGGAAGAIGGTAIRRHLNKKKKAQQEAAEKAAAYYDEAQLVKEAAEANYAEACAYEDAALSILNELGYLKG